MRMGDIVQSESRFLRKEDLKQWGTNGVVLTIANITVENMAQDGQEAKMKTVFHWVEELKPMAINVTNWGKTKMALGVDDETDSEALIGRKLIVWADPTVTYMGKVIGGLVIKPEFVPPTTQTMPSAPAPAAPTPLSPPAPVPAPNPPVPAPAAPQAGNLDQEPGNLDQEPGNLDQEPGNLDQEPDPDGDIPF